MTGKRWILTAVILGSGIVFLDSTIVNVALPRIGRDLHSSWFGVLEGQSYVYNGYLLTLSALLILAGALNDFYGRRRMFAIGLAGFGAASALCGLAPSIELLIIFRVVQGSFAALLVPGSLSIITANFEGEEQGRAFGVWAGASAATTILGPFVGGLLVDLVSWRAAFLVNIPLVAAALYAVVHVPESRDEAATGRFDWLGSAVVAVAVGGLAFGTIYGQQHSWQGPIAYVSIGVAAVALVSFPVLMRRSRNPLVPMSLFRSRNFLVTNISTLLIYGALYVILYFTAVFQQGTLGYTAAAAGLASLPATLFLVIFSSRFGSLAGRYGPRWFMASGPAIMALGILWLARIPAASEAWRLDVHDPATFFPSHGYLADVLPGMVVFGIGLMMMVAPLTTALMTSVPVHSSGVASAINNAISRVGPQLAGALIFIAVTAAFYTSLANRVPGLDTTASQFRAQVSPLNAPPQSLAPGLMSAIKAASTGAFHLSMLVAAALLAAGAVVNAVGICATKAREDHNAAPGRTHAWSCPAPQDGRPLAEAEV